MKERVQFIIEENTVKEIVNSMLCPNCVENKVGVKFIHHQIDTYVIVKCEKDECGFLILDTTKKIKEIEKKNKMYPMTTVLIYCMMLLGVGYRGVDRLISYMNLKHFKCKTYIRYAKYITNCAIIHTGNVLNKSRAAVWRHYAEKQGVLVDGMVQVDVTYDGSWHRRGYKSNFGVGSAIDVDTGLILDYHVCSKLCYVCKTKRTAFVNGKMTEAEYVFWLHEEHTDCDENYEGSSGGMEAAAAVQLWGKSKEHKMLRTLLWTPHTRGK